MRNIMNGIDKENGNHDWPNPGVNLSRDYVRDYGYPVYSCKEIILDKYPYFKSYQGLKSLDKVEGYYIVFLTKENKMYLGYSDNVGGDIYHQWYSKTNDNIERIFDECEVYVYSTKQVVDKDSNTAKETYENIKELIDERLLVDSYMDYIKVYSKNNKRGDVRMELHDVVDKAYDKVSQLDKKKCAIVGGCLASVIGLLLVARKYIKK